MPICMMCGQRIEAGDKAHGQEETLAHLRGWREVWTYGLKSSDPKLVSEAREAICYIDEKLARREIA